MTQWHIDNTQYVLVSNEAEEVVVTDKSQFTNIISTVSHNFDINLNMHDISFLIDLQRHRFALVTGQH